MQHLFSVYAGGRTDNRRQAHVLLLLGLFSLMMSGRTEQHLLSEELHRALALLTPRERSVITLRYGIGDGWSRTLLEVGKELGISRERVRQIEGVALKKMRSKYRCQ